MGVLAEANIYTRLEPTDKARLSTHHSLKLLKLPQTISIVRISFCFQTSRSGYLLANSALTFNHAFPEAHWRLPLGICLGLMGRCST